jgi:hypothetical protein
MWRAKTVLKTASGYADADGVKWEQGKAKGLNLRPSGGDGAWKKVTSSDGEAVVSAANPHSDSSRYLYFDVDSAFAYDLFDQTVVVTVTYRDAGCSAFYLEYDSSDPEKGLFEGAFRKIGDVAVGDTGTWKTTEFTLTQCRFMNRCNNADFRIVILDGELELAVRKIELMRTKITGDKK